MGYTRHFDGRTAWRSSIAGGRPSDIRLHRQSHAASPSVPWCSYGLRHRGTGPLRVAARESSGRPVDCASVPASPLHQRRRHLRLPGLHSSFEDALVNERDFLARLAGRFRHRSVCRLRSVHGGADPVCGRTKPPTSSAPWRRSNDGGGGSHGPRFFDHTLSHHPTFGLQTAWCSVRRPEKGLWQSDFRRHQCSTGDGLKRASLVQRKAVHSRRFARGRTSTEISAR